MASTSFSVVRGLGNALRGHHSVLLGYVDPIYLSVSL
jgi:hypothetical protein